MDENGDVVKDSVDTVYIKDLTVDRSLASVFTSLMFRDPKVPRLPSNSVHTTPNNQDAFQSNSK